VLRNIYFGAIGWTGFILIRILAATWRLEIHGYEHFEELQRQNLPIIYAFWHECILAATFFWRNRGIVVLTSENKDGEYIAHVIHRFGYGSSRGSTSRGAVKGTKGLIRTLKQGEPVAFTVDGPRGPRHQVQQGVTWLAGYSNHPILPFHIEAISAKKLNSWDRFQIPLPFSHVRVEIAEPIFVEKDSSEEVLEEKRIELELVLKRLQQNADDWTKRQLQD
jgi:lysophospholipid acyltransferase (LPLAT)-like uncharacterized protein